MHGCQLTGIQEQLLVSQGRCPDRQEGPREGWHLLRLLISKLWPVVEQQKCACGGLGLPSGLSWPRAAPGWTLERLTGPEPCPFHTYACVCVSHS